MKNMNQKESSFRQRMACWLKVLDRRNADRLCRLDQQTARVCRQSMIRLERLDAAVLRGASKRLVRKRTGRPWHDKLSAWWYNVCQLLDRLDTKIWFRGRPYQAKTCRVRSKAEKRVANCLTDHGLKFKYEKPLQLGKVTLHPDFFLTDHGVYVEYWGLADSDPGYERIHRRKLSLYRKHNVPVISLYPRHLRNLDTVFPRFFQEATNRELL